MPAGISRDKVEARAYEIWVEEGRPHGKHDEHWAKAAAEFEGNGKSSVASDGHATPAPAKAPRKAAAPKAKTAAPNAETKVAAPKAEVKSAAPKAAAAKSEDPTPATKAPVTKAKRASSKAKA